MPFQSKQIRAPLAAIIARSRQIRRDAITSRAEKLLMPRQHITLFCAQELAALRDYHRHY